MELHIKRYPLSIITLIAVWILSFFTPPQTQLDNVPFIDKWVHIAMYGGLTLVIWFEHLRSHKKVNRKRLFMFGIAAPIIMSGIIELLQEYCTPNAIITADRSGDWMDFAANSTGVAIASVIMGLAAMKLKKQ